MWLTGGVILLFAMHHISPVSVFRTSANVRLEPIYFLPEKKTDIKACIFFSSEVMSPQVLRSTVEKSCCNKVDKTNKLLNKAKWKFNFAFQNTNLPKVLK